jgi:RNA polymerase sigma factor (sigma-70 family)
MFNLNKRNSEFIEIYNDYYSLIFGSVCMRINSIDDAEDITQEIFIRFFNKMDEVDNPRKWLLGAMRMVLFEFYKKKRDDVLDIDEVFTDVSLTFINGMKEQRLIISDILEDDSTFGNNQNRLIFDLIAIQRYTMEAAAKELGLSRDQVKYRYGVINKNILILLRKKGITNLEDLL